MGGRIQRNGIATKLDRCVGRNGCVSNSECVKRLHRSTQRWRKSSMNEREWWYERMYVRYVPLRCFGQHTNSTPENSDIPQGNNIAKLLRFIFLSLHVSAAVAFHLKRKIPRLCSQFLFLSANYELAFRRIALYILVCKILFDFSNGTLSIGHVLRSIVRPWMSMDFREF